VELFGISAPNEFLFQFMKFHNIESTSKCMKCVDNKAAISWVNWTQHMYSRPRQYSYDVDIITVIVDQMKELTHSMFPSPVGESSSRWWQIVWGTQLVGTNELWCW
jgi:hypothetical protein